MLFTFSNLKPHVQVVHVSYLSSADGTIVWYVVLLCFQACPSGTHLYQLLIHLVRCSRSTTSYKYRYICRISLINTAFLISIAVGYYLNTNNIDLIVILINRVPSNSIACHLATPGITGNYRVCCSGYSSWIIKE